MTLPRRFPSDAELVDARLEEGEERALPNGWRVLNPEWPQGDEPHIVCGDDDGCAQCGATATDTSWGVLLCGECETMTARGDGGES